MKIFFIITFLILPYILITAGYIYQLRKVYRSKSPGRSLTFYPLIGSMVTTCGVIIAGFHDISSSKSSTAAIGYLALPFASVIVAVAGFIVLWSFIYIIRFAFERIGLISNRITSIRFLILGALVLCLTGFVSQHLFARNANLYAAASTTTNQDDLEIMLASALHSHDLEVLSLFAKNPKTPVGDLIRIYDSCKNRVFDFSPPEYIVFRSLAQNPNTPPDILVVLAKCQQTTVRYLVGRNPGTPIDILKQLSKDKEELVRFNVMFNPKFNRDLLLQLANDSDPIFRDKVRSRLRDIGPTTRNGH